MNKEMHLRGLARAICVAGYRFKPTGRPIILNVMPLRYLSVGRTMNPDYETLAYMAWNLGEAQEELSRLLDALRPGAEFDEAEFRVGMAHLFSHLNTAWNVRNASASEIDAASGERINAWMCFPDDLSVP